MGSSKACNLSEAHGENVGYLCRRKRWRNGSMLLPRFRAGKSPPMDRSRLPSLKGTITIPKLKLNACTLTARLAYSIFEKLRSYVIIGKVFIFLDSEIILNWLQSKSGKDVAKWFWTGSTKWETWWTAYKKWLRRTLRIHSFPQESSRLRYL